MIKFEEYLISRGYEQFAFSFDKGYYKPKTYIISSMVNLGHIYIHPDKQEKILIGLHEKDKPVTLISPRPRIEVKRLIDDKVVIFNEWYDDEMNVVLRKVDFDLIYNAMYEKDIIIKVDLTK
jgi:hypothetical protein